MDNREALLSKLTKEKQNRQMTQRSLAARDRLVEREKAKEAGGLCFELVDANAEKTSKPPVVIFGVKAHFTMTLKDTLQQYCEIFEFEETNKASDFLFENPVPIAFIDMDPPNEHKDALDFFSTGKTINPNMKYIVYRKEENISESIEALKKQGATVLNKPLNKMDLIEKVKEYTAQWREENEVAPTPQADGSQNGEECDVAEENIAAY